MAPLRVLSWNVRGLADKIKRSLVFDYIKKYNPHICILQETHLVGSKIMSLRRPWVGRHFHATHSGYSRGVSILIHKSLQFELLDVKLDPGGRYILIHAIIDTVEMVLVGIYLPPPADISLIHNLIPMLAQYPTDNVLLAGDFNIAPDPSRDRLTPDPATNSSLSRWAGVFGFKDVWRWKYPNERSYTCCSLSHNTLSRIDLIYASGNLLPKIREIKILPRGISDHSPMFCVIQATTPPADRIWRLSRFWIKHPTIEFEMATLIRQYWLLNADSTSPGNDWDAFKAYIRGCYMSSIATERKNNQITLEEAEAKAQTLESDFALTANPITGQDMKAAYREVLLLRVAKANNKQLVQSQKIFEQGEKTGRLLAWLAKEQSITPTIARIAATDGTIKTDPVDINTCFMEFYSNLYSSRAEYSVEELSGFLDEVEFPTLTTEDRQLLDSPITIEEVQLALGSLQPGKTPGMDGFPPEFYQQYTEEMAPRIHNMLVKTLREGTLPPSMAQAIIVVVPKSGKDPQLCSSYRPISLLNSDAKILTKILARRLNEVILSLVHEDQSGFMPGKGTDINLRRLYAVLASGIGDVDQAVVASLDAEKAFDSVEWKYLWEVLRRFGFGPVFISWVEAVYRSPTARVRTGAVLSPSFPLRRGTRQGCPLSPGLFALAIEPMAILIRSTPQIQGITIGPIQEKVSLYADDTLLYLTDDGQSLTQALQVIDRCGRYSGIRINWGKSVLFPLHSGVAPLHLDAQLCRVSQFRYLGVEIHRDLKQFIGLNLTPVMARVTHQFSSWKTLPLSPVGRVNLIKMSILPKFTYLFRQTPVPIPLSFFTKLDSLVTSFVWNGKAPRIAKTTLQLPVAMGGLALPCFLKYYWAAVLVTLKWWLAEEPSNPASAVEAALLGSYSELRNLIHKGPRSSPKISVPMKTTIKVWDTVNAKLGTQNALSPVTPLWGNPRLSHFRSIPDPVIWARYGIVTLGDIVSQGQLITFDDLKSRKDLPNQMFFRFLQLRHAFRSQFPNPITLWMSDLEAELRAPEGTKLLSFIYNKLALLDTSRVSQLLTTWQHDIPDLTEDDWEEGVQQYLTLTISSKDRFSQLKFLHRAYYSPSRLAKIYTDRTATCPRCGSDDADFYHTVWSCPRIVVFWKLVLDDINSVGRIRVPYSPLPLLLGMCGSLEAPRRKKLFVFYTAMYARKAILLNWNQPQPPTKQLWLSLINAALPLYKLTYMGRNCPKKFDAVWADWVEAKHLTIPY